MRKSKDGNNMIEGNPQRPRLNDKIKGLNEESPDEIIDRYDIILNDLENWLEDLQIHDEQEELEEVESWLEINYAETPYYDKVRQIVARRYDIHEDMGGASTPMATLGNVPGGGTAQPATTAATSGAQQNSPDALGSGDRWDNTTKDNKKKRKKKKKKENVDEMNINPHDKIGTMMAKKMKVPMTFKKGKGDQDVKQTKFDKGSHKIMDYTSYANLVKNNKKL